MQQEALELFEGLSICLPYTSTTSIPHCKQDPALPLCTFSSCFPKCRPQHCFSQSSCCCPLLYPQAAEAKMPHCSSVYLKGTFASALLNRFEQVTIVTSQLTTSLCICSSGGTSRRWHTECYHSLLVHAKKFVDVRYVFVCYFFWLDHSADRSFCYFTVLPSSIYVSSIILGVGISSPSEFCVLRTDNFVRPMEQGLVSVLPQELHVNAVLNSEIILTKNNLESVMKD